MPPPPVSPTGAQYWVYDGEKPVLGPAPLSELGLRVHWRRKWQPTPVFLPGESQRQGSLVGCRLLGHTESDMTGATQQQQQHAFQGCQTINKCHLGIVNHGIFSENTHTHTHTHNVLSLNQFVEETKSWLHLVLPIYK